VVRSDEEHERWRSVRLAVQPDERAATVAELRGMERPGRVLLLAEIDGVVGGSGVADRSDLAGRAFVALRVMPGDRRRGVGTVLLRAP
jgi:GNAT superfamily N-acetyltransferase